MHLRKHPVDCILLMSNRTLTQHFISQGYVVLVFLQSPVDDV